MAELHFLHVPQGVITIGINNKTYSCEITGNEKFAALLARAHRRGHNPAEVLQYLAILGLHLYHPNSPMLKHRDQERWETYFGNPEKQ